MPSDRAALVWFRRDLRAADHAALHAALRGHRAVHCVFVFDTEILDALPSRADRRVDFIWRSLGELRAALRALGGGLHVLHGRARQEVPRLAARLGVAAVYANRDYEPQAIERDREVESRLLAQGIALHSRKDQVIFELDEILTVAGRPYSVFTPYKNAWLKKLAPFYLKAYPIRKHAQRLARTGTELPSLRALGFRSAPMALPAGMSGGQRLFADFNAGRVRVLLGGSQTMGTGVNVQHRLKALHHLDVPWLPAEIEQREGRIERQGNAHDEIEIYAYATLGSMDAPMWQSNERKARFIAAALAGDRGLRRLEDAGSQAGQFALAKAIASGDPRLMHKAGLEAEIARLRRLRAAHSDDRHAIRTRGGQEQHGRARDERPRLCVERRMHLAAHERVRLAHDLAQALDAVDTGHGPGPTSWSA